jgi:hypothetical protein
MVNSPREHVSRTEALSNLRRTHIADITDSLIARRWLMPDDAQEGRGERWWRRAGSDVRNTSG